MSALLQALGSARRRAILQLVWEEERSAGDIHRAFDDVTFGAISQQLRVLENADLVRVRREGRQRLYRARPDQLGALRSWLEQSWNDALQVLADRAEMEATRRGPRSRERRSSSQRPIPLPRKTPSPRNSSTAKQEEKGTGRR